MSKIKKPKSFVEKVTLEVFEADIYIVITEDPNSYVENAGISGWVKDYPDQDLQDHTDAMTFRVGFSDMYLLMSPNATVGTMAHECIHCICSIFNDRGIKSNLDDTENLAYHVGWLTDMTFKAFRKSMKLWK